jgi:hypothetical protein
MAFFRKVLKILEITMKTPKLYGWFHLLCLGIMVGAAVVLCTRYRKIPKNGIRKGVMAVAIITILLEVYKQIVFTFDPIKGGISMDYQWYAFPFQFCSTPMYAGLLTGVFRKGKIHEALCAYLASYSIFAGCCVMFYPAQVFIDTVGINIQTMFWHGGMVVVGIWLLATGYVRVNKTTILKAMCVFLCFIGVAMVMNEIAYHSDLIDEAFNMFYISPHLPSTLPVYSAIHNALPYPISLTIYVLAFTMAADLILCVGYFFQNLSHYAHKKTVVLR